MVLNSNSNNELFASANSNSFFDEQFLTEAINKDGRHGSPKVLGTAKYVCLYDSLDQLLVGKGQATYALRISSFFGEQMPRFGLSSIPIVNLFWEVVTNNGNIERTPEVMLHRWDSTDQPFWKHLKLTKDNLLFIVLKANKENLSVSIQFVYNGVHSAQYSVPQNTMNGHGFLVLLFPIEHFETNYCEFLSASDSLKALSHDKKEAEASRSLDLVDCLSCDRKIEVVYDPCGHAPFCFTCDRTWRTPEKKECPNCKTEVTARTEMKFPSTQKASCLVCPRFLNCNNVSCIVVPCGHAIGCMKSAERTLLPGDMCPVEDCSTPIEKMFRVYIQE